MSHGNDRRQRRFESAVKWGLITLAVCALAIEIIAMILYPNRRAPRPIPSGDSHYEEIEVYRRGLDDPTDESDGDSEELD